MGDGLENDVTDRDTSECVLPGFGVTEVCTVGHWSFKDADVEKACSRAYREAVREGRGVYLVVDAAGHLHAFLAPHKPAQEVLAIVGTEEDGSAAVVWMQEWMA